MTPAEVAAAHPVAVQVARSFKAVFGDVKLTYAKNLETGAAIGKSALAQARNSAANLET